LLNASEPKLIDYYLIKILTKEKKEEVYIGGRVKQYPVRAAKALVISEPIHS